MTDSSDPNAPQDAAPEPAAEPTPPSDPPPRLSPAVPPPNPLKELGRYLYNSNPFYVISAILILVGLHQLCNDEGVLADPNSVAAAGWTHLSLLAGYTVLLAVAGVVVVRLAKVWEDARTILLSVLLLLVAMSVEFDHLLLTRPATAKGVLCVGAGFALLLVEATIRGVRVRLPLGYRIPLFAALALFFLYPVLVLTVLDQVGYANNDLGREGTKWLVFLFPAAAALVALMLLPAAAKGGAYVAENGTPWRWPWYPWPVFFFLAVGVCFRSYYLTISFDPQTKLESAFGLYYLTPFLLAVCAVVFEAGRASKSEVAQWLALLAPATLVLLTMPGQNHSATFDQMLRAHLTHIGPPVKVACIGLLVLYGWAILRGAWGAWVGVSTLLFFLAFVGPKSVDFAALASKPAAAPFAVLAVCATYLILRSRRFSAPWMLLALSLLGLALALTPGSSTSGTQFGALVVVICGVAVLLGATFTDVFAQIVAEWGVFGLLTASFYICFSASPSTSDAQDKGLALGVALVVSAIQFLHARRTKTEFAWTLGWLSLIPVGVRLVVHVMNLLRLLRNPMAVVLVVGGTASFVLGALITAVKAGWRPLKRQKEVPEAAEPMIE